MRKRKWFITIIGFTGALSILLYVYTVYNTDQSKEDLKRVEMDDTKEQILSDIESVKKQNDVSEWVEGLEIHEGGHIGQTNEEVLSNNDEPFEALEFLTGSLLLEDVDLFSQAFDTAEFSQSIINAENDNKMEVLEGFMNEMTRNGTLVNVSAAEQEKGPFNAKDGSLLVKFEYDDGVIHEIKLQTKAIKHYHKERGKEVAIRVIETPPEDIVQKLNNKKERD